MDLKGRVISRSGDAHTSTITVYVVTGRIKLSAHLCEGHKLYEETVGFGYSPDSLNPHTVALYPAEDGCKVSKQGNVQSRYHAEKLANLYKRENGTVDSNVLVFTMEDKPEYLGDIPLYELTPVPQIQPEDAPAMVAPSIVE